MDVPLNSYIFRLTVKGISEYITTSPQQPSIMMLLLLLLAALFLWMPISSFGFLVISSSEITKRGRQSVSSSPLAAMQMKLKSSDDSSIDAPSTSSSTISSSLASDYAIRIHPPPNNKNQLHWELYPLSNWKESSSDVTGVGTIALRALDDCTH